MKQGSAAAIADPRPGRTYVPVYSSLHWGFDNQLVDMTATLSVRNVSSRHPVIIESVRYYDSLGRMVREYLEDASELPPMASVEFVIQRRDRVGGPGANFLVDWTVTKSAEAPYMEAVMVGQHGSAGLSFTSPGHIVQRD